MRRHIKRWKKAHLGLVAVVMAIGTVLSVLISHHAIEPAIAQGEQPCWRSGNLLLFTPKPDVGHSRPVRSVAFSPDGKFLVSGSADKTIKIWELVKVWNQTVRPLVLAPNPEEITSVAFSADNQILVSGSLDGSVRLWDWKARRVISTETIYPSRTGVSVAFSPNGQTLAAAGFNRNTIVFWDMATRTKREWLVSEKFGVGAMAFNPDGETLAVSTMDGFVKLWNWQTGEVKQMVRDDRYRDDKFPTPVNSLSFSPDGQLLAFVPHRLTSSSEHNQICFWNRQGERVGNCLQGHTDDIPSMAFSPDGKYLISGSWDDSVIVWNVISRTLVYRSPQNSKRILSVAFSPDGQSFARGSGDYTWKILKCKQ
ncbi:MAG: WD40 repeat domain-containing protein [Cyanobacteria bacterium]|nr:WD40 repeat domain-containing protein [Cyanobacteriota bacterium]MDW8199804.1 WD40 repeat domain-containing protein [Cyanobacteriota bacterium SKYGB_h_bin112]